AGVGATINDPVSRTLVDYREAMVDLAGRINEQIVRNRARILAPGADVSLVEGADQSTVYRPDDLLIRPCNAAQVCEMSGPLTSTRALLGLFPDEYLVADQSGLGKVEICYENMSWQQRRSEQVRADDTNVANYYGKLEFELKGRYRQQDSVNEIFGFRFTSPQEHHYLFAAMNDEVLNDECPMEWIGQRIITPLKRDRGGVVPNRLTYLSAPRMLPSRLLSGNWDRGAEWRDWFITGIGVQPLDIDPAPDISGELNQHLQALYRAEQAAIYASLLQPPVRGVTPLLESLAEQTSRLTTIKSLIRQQFILFYPQVLNESDELRSAIAGKGGLVDGVLLSRFRADNVPVQSISQMALERLERTEMAWRAQADMIRRSGSIAGSLAHAIMRLNELYSRFFAAPPPAAPPPEADPGAEDEPTDGTPPNG
ncbi:MAG: hypothetical protein KJO85_11520, partial [Gammaproteobacteria bacterium]|nr:hypothetical protein [Gammaproteobacteria bacterium]